jgi:hypothetical protein
MRAPSTRGGVAAAAGTVVAVAVLAAILIVARGWWSGAGGSYAPPKPIARASIVPPRSLFGQVLTATATVVVDPRRVDPSSVDADVSLRPFAVRSETRSVRRGVGRAQIVTLTYRIQCVVRACVPKGAVGRARGAATVVQIARGRITAHRRDGTQLSIPITWPAIGVQSRLTSDDIAFSTPELDSGFAPPPFDFRIRPNVLAGTALGLAIALVALASWIVVATALGDTTPLRRRRIPAHLTPVQRALMLAQHAVDRQEIPESRKALERLAVLLRDGQQPGPADSAERLAWSEEAPSREGLASLADRVRSNGA